MGVNCEFGVLVNHTELKQLNIKKQDCPLPVHLLGQNKADMLVLRVSFVVKVSKFVRINCTL